MCTVHWFACTSRSFSAPHCLFGSAMHSLIAVLCTIARPLEWQSRSLIQLSRMNRQSLVLTCFGDVPRYLQTLHCSLLSVFLYAGMLSLPLPLMRSQLNRSIRRHLNTDRCARHRSCHVPTLFIGKGVCCCEPTSVLLAALLCLGETCMRCGGWSAVAGCCSNKHVSDAM